MRKRQAASDLSVQKLTTDLTKDKARFVHVTTERLELSKKLGAVAAESENKRFEELTVVRGARDSVERLVWSIVGQSVEAQGAFVNQVGTQLVDLFRIGLEGAYPGSQLACTYTLTHVSGG